MEHKIKELPKSEVEITVTVIEEEMHEYRKKATAELSKDVKIKGFRPGKAPLHILEQYVDKKFIEAHAQELAIKMSYAKIVVNNKIQVVSRPTVEVEKNDKPGFTYSAKVAVMPEVSIKGYESIKVKKQEVKVSDKDINEVISDMKTHATTYEEVDRAAKNDDRVEIDFEGFDTDGKAVENTASKNHPVILGKNTLIPGFEEKVVGMKKDQDKEFDITFPEDYFKKDFQNKKMKFKVKLHKVEEPKIPELNEKLIESMTGKKIKVEEFKKDIEKNILNRKETEVKQKAENEYIEELLKKAKVEFPEALIDEETQHIVNEVKGEIEQKGQDFEKFIENNKTTLEDLKKKYRPEAEKRLKIRLALQKIITEEKISIGDNDVQAEFEKIQSFYPEAEHAKIQKDFDKGQLRTQIENRLTLRMLFDKVIG